MVSSRDRAQDAPGERRSGEELFRLVMADGDDRVAGEMVAWIYEAVGQFVDWFLESSAERRAMVTSHISKIVCAESGPIARGGLDPEVEVVRIASIELHQFSDARQVRGVRKLTARSRSKTNISGIPEVSDEDLMFLYLFEGRGMTCREIVEHHGNPGLTAEFIEQRLGVVAELLGRRSSRRES